jgi:hypothetical protein
LYDAPGFQPAHRRRAGHCEDDVLFRLPHNVDIKPAGKPDNKGLPKNTCRSALGMLEEHGDVPSSFVAVRIRTKQPSAEPM